MFNRIQRGLAARGELRGMRDKFAPSPEEQLHYYPGYEFPMLPRDYAALQEARGNSAGERRTALGQINSAKGKIDTAEGQLHQFDSNAARHNIMKDWGTVTITGGKWERVKPGDYGFRRVNVADDGDDEQWMWENDDDEDSESWGDNWLRRGNPDRNPQAWTGGHKLQQFQVPVDKINELQGIDGLTTSRHGNNLTISFGPRDKNLQDQVSGSFQNLEHKYQSGIDTALTNAQKQWDIQVRQAQGQINEAQGAVNQARNDVTDAAEGEQELIADKNNDATTRRNQWEYNATHMKEGV